MHVRQHDPNLRRITAYADIVDYFYEKFSSEDFFNIWTPMKGLFDYDESTELGRFFC